MKRKARGTMVLANCDAKIIKACLPHL
jgi:ribosomal protein L35